MAEPEVATKSPESDAAESSTVTAPASLVPGDPPAAQTDASLGEHKSPESNAAQSSTATAPASLVPEDPPAQTVASLGEHKSPESNVAESSTVTAPAILVPKDPPAQTVASLGEHKSPKSDAAESSTVTAPAILVPGDTPTQTGAGPWPSGQGSTGEITTLGGVDVYISKPADYPIAPSKLLLFLTGATGLHSANNQIQADNFAREGFLVLLPDMFGNDPLPGTATYEEEKDPSLIEQIAMRTQDAIKSFSIDMWLARQTAEKVLPILHKVIDAAKDEFADAVANGGGIYSVGYCFGGRMTLLLAGEKQDTAVPWGQAPKDEEAGVVKAGPFIKAGAIVHATLVTREDFEGTKVPLAFICVENDQLFEEEVREHGEKYLKENNIETEFKTYSGVPHGFGVVGEYEDIKIKAAQAEAFDQILAWLKKH